MKSDKKLKESNNNWVCAAIKQIFTKVKLKEDYICVKYFIKFIIKVINDLTHYKFNFYKKCVKNNINLLHSRSVCTFPKFDLNFRIYYFKINKKKT
jgi:hypothetical protein